MFKLLKESFRQNPDYLIVGEVRGKEAYILFQGMASGHPSMSTFHSGGVEDLIKRLQTAPISLSSGLLESLDVVITMVHAQEKSKSARRVKDIVEIESIDTTTGTPRTNKSFIWRPSSDTHEYRGNSWVLNKICSEKGYTMQNVVRDITKRKELLDWMCARSLTSMDEVVNYIKMFRTDSSKIQRIIAQH
jgi:flagellar protein FlaI